MFDISFLEITVIFVITLLVVGPEKLPALVRDVGRVVKKIRRIVTQTRYELEREIDFEEERKKLTKGKEGLDEAMDELDDLMNIAPDRDQNTPNPDLDDPGKDQNTPNPDLDKPGKDQNAPNLDLDKPGKDQNAPNLDLDGPGKDQDESNLAQKENDGEADDKNQSAGP